MPRFLKGLPNIWTILGWILIISSFLKQPVVAGILIALAGHLLTQAKHRDDLKEKQSLFYLDAWVKAYEEAQSLLKDGNNDRVEWIAAARALLHAEQLEKKITEDAHLELLDLYKLKYRHFFYSIIDNKPESFFHDENDRDKALSEPSVYAIWKAAQWSEEYNDHSKDPLKRKFADDEVEKTKFASIGLYRFLKKKRTR